MTNSHHDIRAPAARRALEAYKVDASKELETSITDLITDIGHLCTVEHIDFLATLSGGIRHWAVERVNPNSTLPGPTVEITISVQRLPRPPKSKNAAHIKAKKLRTPC